MKYRVRFHYGYKCSMLNGTLDVGGMFSLAQDAVVKSWAGGK